MASLLEAVRKAVGSYFGRNPKPAVTKPNPSWAYRGAPKKVASHEEALPERVDAEQLDRFLYDGAILEVNSTNVRAFQYDEGRQKLVVTFKAKTSPDGKYYPESQYVYDQVPLEKAMTIAQEFSKGGAVWSHLRVRGSRTGHQHPYRRIR